MRVKSKYRQAFEEDCIELIVHAYNLAITEKKYHLDWMENDFSELLCHYANESQLSIDKKITCKTEKKLLTDTDNKEKGFANSLPRIDFVYFKIWREKRLQCFMEAKRLKEKDSDLKRAYIEEGMDRFITEKYPIGCMLGYLLEGDTEKTRTGINKILEKRKRNSEILLPKPYKIFHFYYESNHPQIGIIKHLIFDFTAL